MKRWSPAGVAPRGDRAQTESAKAAPRIPCPATRTFASTRGSPSPKLVRPWGFASPPTGLKVAGSIASPTARETGRSREMEETSRDGDRRDEVKRGEVLHRARAHGARGAAGVVVDVGAVGVVDGQRADAVVGPHAEREGPVAVDPRARHREEVVRARGKRIIACRCSGRRAPGPTRARMNRPPTPPRARSTNVAFPLRPPAYRRLVRARARRVSGISDAGRVTSASLRRRSAPISPTGSGCGSGWGWRPRVLRGRAGPSRCRRCAARARRRGRSRDRGR